MNKRAALAFLLVSLLLAASMQAASALTPAGTVITETVTITFNDVAGTGASATSNTVTVTVQNAASMTVTAPTGVNVTPYDVTSDSLILTNTGNGVGGFTLSANPSFGGTAPGTTLKGYILAGGPGTCTVAAPCALATLNAQTAMTSVAINGTVTVGVEFQVGPAVTAGQTIQPSQSATIAYAAGTGTLAQTSASAANAAYSDTVITDARLDVQATVVSPTGFSGAAANITWTVRANNGGGASAFDLLSAQTALGAAKPGIALFVPMPSFPAGTTYLQLTTTPTLTLTGGGVGSAVALYYNATACSAHPSSLWSTTYSPSSRCLAVYISGNINNAELPAVAVTSAGSVTSGQAQIALSFTTTPPTGAGSGNANAVTLLTSSAIGGAAWASGVFPILGQGVAPGTPDAATASLLNGIQTNVTASSGTTPPGGASNAIWSQAYANAPQLGPYNGIGAIGSYDGAVAVNASDAFTAQSYAPAGGSVLLNSGTTAGTPIGVSITTSGITTVNVPNAVTYQAASGGATLTLTGTAAAGWKVQICQDAAGPVCATSGFWTTVNLAGTTSSSILTLTSLQSLSNYKFWAVYTLASASNVSAFSRADATLLAADANSSATTHNELYAGFVPLTRSVTVASTGCPGGVTPPAGGVCPGGMLLYTIDYRNIVAGSSAGGSTEPESAFPETAAGSLVLTENGAYLANTGGLNEPLIAGANGTTTFGDSTAGSTFAGNIVGSTNFADTVGGASFKLVPAAFTGTNKGQQGTFTFRVLVK